MADFVAVLRKTLDGLGETTPEMRTRVYDKARMTVAAKLAAIDPPPPAQVADRQRRALEDAIASIESEYTPAKPAFGDPLEELESVFAALKEGKPIAPARPAVRAPAPSMPQASQRREVPPREAPLPPAGRKPDPIFEDYDDGEEEVAFEDDRPVYDDEEEPRRKRSYGGLIAAVIVLALLGGGTYGIWLNRSEFKDLLASAQSYIGKQMPSASDEPASQSAADGKPADAKPAGQADVASAPAPEAAKPNSQQAPESETKYTQRLNADGTEVDAGPAGGTQTFGEGTSVASLTAAQAGAQPAPPVSTPPADAAAPPPDAATPSADTAQADPAAPADAAAPTADAATPPADAAVPPLAGTDTAGGDATQRDADPAAAPDAAAAASGTTPASTPPSSTQIAVGQRAIFYEERTAASQGSAEPGSIVWSEVQESPGGDAPPEPAIRAEATIPGKDIQLRMTIRRNADKTLPASHIVEMIFLTPEGFDGGGIDNVLRIAMKSSEQDAGSPLIGIPAKIADGFFLVALNDSKNEIDANMNLLQKQSWIDIPIVYKNGRRALFTMEKGVPGEKVFADTIKAWAPKTAG